VTALLAASRLCSPSPLYDIAGWASSAAVAELLGVPPMLLNDDRLGRALEALAPVAEQLRGELLRAVREFPAAGASRLHLDLTAVRFAGAYEDSALVARGWSADRTIKRQVKTLQASSPSGVAVCFRPHQGATGEPPAFLTAVEALAAALPAAPVIVADSGLGYLEHLCALDTKKVAFVVALRAGTGWAARFDADIGPAGGLAALAPLGYVCAREKRLPEDERTRWKGLLAPFPVTRTNDDRQEVRHDLRAAYIWSSEEAATVAAARQRALDKAEDALHQSPRPWRPRPAHRAGRAADLQGPVDRRAAPPRPQADATGPAGVPAQRRPDRGPDRRHRQALLIYGLIEAELRAEKRRMSSS
jgi:hypothetical protein